MYIATGSVTEQNVGAFFKMILQERVSFIVTIGQKTDNAENVKYCL
jgi:hypothetical protein